jgi:glutathione synthase/RimK-type ligase-like ATP-grasp enzyme
MGRRPRPQRPSREGQTVLIGIQPDDFTDREEGREDASAPRWIAALERAGHEVRLVDVRRPDILQQLRGCRGFMWRWSHQHGEGRIARRLLPLLEHDLGLVVYPDQATCRHFDDKIAQAWMFEAHDLPAPRTRVFFDREEARAFAAEASWPLVLKLATGAGASNVVLVESADEARTWIDVLFGPGVWSLEKGRGLSLTWGRRIRAAHHALVRGHASALPRVAGWNIEGGYALFQEFLPDNACDTRVTVIGDRAFGFRRLNRTDDFRASGSGNIDWDPEGIAEAMVRLAFGTARAFGSQSLAIDGLWRGDEAIVVEVSYTYASWAVHACPGHWVLDGDPDTGNLAWRPGPMWPEDAQVEDFLARLEDRADA